MSEVIGMWVEVNRGRLLERFSSADLLKEVSARKTVPLPVSEDQQELSETLMGFITEAISFLKSGRSDDALLTLERGAFPKFKNPEQASARYLTMVGK